MLTRAIKGAITVDDNTEEQIILHTKALLNEMITLNNVDLDDAICIFFTSTKDLDAAFPAVAARKMGMNNIPLMCSNEIDVPHSLERCIRIAFYFNTEKSLEQIHHVYLRDAKNLRPDLAR